MLKKLCAQIWLIFCSLSFAIALAMVCPAGLKAQGSTATILGTVTDSSGAAVAGAMVTAKNTGTGVTTATVTDSQGRYMVPALIIGTYEVDVEASGFKKYAHGGIDLTVGSQTVVDVSLEVGTVQQTVTVEADVSHVETQSAAITALVEQKQIVDLPLNGRNFVNLVALQPGVVPTAASGGSFYGNQSNNAIGGYRPSGTAYMLDDTNTVGWWGHAAGNGSTGTTLGIDSIAEFQTLTNTYSAQFGGAGAAVNASSKSGTNSFHGTAYEFLRNTSVESVNLYVPTATPLPAPVLNRNQFGASIGGPLKKNKAFFFANYEGLQLAQKAQNTVSTPDWAARGCANQAQADADNGFCGLAGGTPKVNGQTIPLPACGAGGYAASAYPNGDPCTAQKAIAATMSLTPWDNLFADNPTTGLASWYATSPTYSKEHYLLTRFDYTLSDKDTFFARYLLDRGTVVANGNQVQASTCPTSVCSLIPQFQYSTDTFATIEERHIFSPTLLNTAHFAFTRPNDSAYQYASPVVPTSVTNGGFTNCAGCPANQPLWFFAPELGGETGSISGVVSGATSTLPYYLTPNGFRWGDDMVWTKGAHSFKFGAEIDRLRDNSWAPFTTGNTFTPTTVGQGSLAGYLAGEVNTVSGQFPASLQVAQGGQYPDQVRDYREMQYSFYAEDNFKATSHLTVNLGIRYSPTNNAPIVRHQTTNTFGAFSNDQGTDPECTQDFQTLHYYPVNCGFVPISTVFQNNISLKNIDPRIGIAWDPFKDHKTSFRAGFGRTSVVASVRDWNYWLQPPVTLTSETFGKCANTTPTSGAWVINTNPINAAGTGGGTCQAGTPFGYPFAYSTTAAGICGTPGQINSSGCTAPQESTEYNQTASGAVYQWNATVQREILPQTIVSIGYVGTHGIHLLAEEDFNPVTPCGGTDPATGQQVFVVSQNPAVGYSGSAWILCPRINPAYGAINYMGNMGESWYNSLQVSVNRRFSKGFQTQFSYTYSKTEDNSSGGYGLDGGGTFCNVLNVQSCKALSPWNRTNNLRVSSVYLLPFHGNQLVEGWQVSGVGSFLSGTPFSVASLNVGQGGGSNMPNYIAGCDPYTHVTAQQAVNKYLSGSNTGQYPFGAGASIANASTNPYLNAACFTLPAPGEHGNLGRDVLVGPGMWNIDLSVFKDTKITKISENFVVEFRAEFYNVLNHPSFSNPNATLWSALSPTTGGINVSGVQAVNNSSTTFGQISGETSTPRQMQFGLRVSF